ncbi:hypothetical protein MMC07_009955 [Pseudocyphellaria aurata]|nr:hypothetical protein [Pseudocyphellaria aurata]
MDRPSLYIVESLYRLKKQEQKEKKASTPSNPFGGTTEGPQHSVPSAYPGFPPVPPFPYPYYPPAPPQPQPTDSLIAILALKEKKQIDRKEREDQERRPGRSIPVQEDLEDYIQWHIRRQPRKSLAFKDAFDKLDTAGYDVQAVQTWKGDAYEQKWKDLDILIGTGLQLARDASKFHKENMETRGIDPQQDLSLRFSPRHKSQQRESLSQTWKPLSYARLESQMKTQEEDDKETGLVQTVEGDSGTDLDYDNDGGISDLDDIDPTQSQ